MLLIGGDYGGTNLKNANNRYKNIYTSNYVAKNGDAVIETKGWHGSTFSEWNIDYGNLCTMVRSISGSIFSYATKNGGGYEGVAAINKAYATRAVIVVGTGI